jgi:hypothetical protein
MYIHVLLLDTLQVPTYAKYLRDIINKNRPLPQSSKLVMLMEDCSATILNSPLEKKDPRCPTISCSIRSQYFNHALCGLGASVSIMPKVVFDKLNYTSLVLTAMCL